MRDEENFGYCLSVSAITDEELVQNLKQIRKSYQKYTTLSLLEAATIPYIMNNASGVFSEPWDSVVASGLLLAEILAVGAGLYSAYTWRKTSKQLSLLKRMY